MPFAENLKYLMDAYKLTKYRLAKELGCSQTTISNYLDGITKPRQKAQKQIADKFGITVKELMGDDLPHIKGENKLKITKKPASETGDGKYTPEQIWNAFESADHDTKEAIRLLLKL